MLVPVGGEIQHHAEPVALLAAPDRETLRAAQAPRQARHGAAPAGLRPLESRRTSSPSTRSTRATSTRGFAAADLIIEGTYRVGHQEQLYIENNAMIAVPREDGGVDGPRLAAVPVLRPQGAQASARARPPSRRAVIQAETGGGFGGKEEYPSMLALHAALLARKAGSPCG